MSEAKRKTRLRKWSEAQTIKFVELYEGEEVLWNVRLDEYKVKDARESAVMRLIENLDLPVLCPEDVLKKINNIRSTFRQEMMKVRASETASASAGDVYVPSLPWFDIANRFLPSVMELRKTGANLNGVDSAESQGNCYSESFQTPAKESEVQQPQLSTSTGPTARPNINQEFKEPSPGPLLPPPKRRFQALNPQHLTSPPEHMGRLVTCVQSHRHECRKKDADDEFSHFGRNVAAQLRQLPLFDALDLQTNIMQAIQTRRQDVASRIQLSPILSTKWNSLSAPSPSEPSPNLPHQVADYDNHLYQSAESSESD